MKIYTPENGKLVEDDWVRPSIFLAGIVTGKQIGRAHV